jgi:hypothetical protein
VAAQNDANKDKTLPIDAAKAKDRTLPLGTVKAKDKTLPLDTVKAKDKTLPIDPRDAASHRTQLGLGFSPVEPASPHLAPNRAGSSLDARTLVGVARPGIAPRNPHEPKALPSPLPVALPVPDAGDKVGSYSPRATTRLPRAGWIAVAATCIAGALGVSWLLASRDTGPIVAQAVLDSEGKEQLQLTCRRCEDGTRARLNGKDATFQGKKAVLPLAKPLSIGENTLSLEVSLSSTDALETVELNVPLLYRVHGDLSALNEDVPKLAVRFEAMPGTRVVVDRQSLQLDRSGSGTHHVDVGKHLVGPSSQVERLRRDISYRLTPPDASEQVGSVELQIGIAPLVVDAPGPSITVDSPHFTLAGQTLPGGVVTVDGQVLAVDGSGRFAQRMDIKSAGERTLAIRAVARDIAPRTVPVRIRRVASLSAEVRRLRGHAVSSYAALAEQPKDSHPNVVVTGSVVEARTQRHTTVALLDVSAGCRRRPCLARVVHGATAMLRSEENM